MKSITKKLSLLIILSSVLFLSSCLSSGSNSYIGNGKLALIVQGSNNVYARTEDKLYIISPEIKQLTPGSIVRLSFQVDFDEGKLVAVDAKNSAYEVELAGQPEELKQTELQNSEAPDEPIVKFEFLSSPKYAQDDFFGDRWIFIYENAQEESVNVNFYKASEEDAKAMNTDVLIDVRLEVVGTAEKAVSEKKKDKYIVVNLSDLRTDFADKADIDGNIKIKFRNYRIGNENAEVSNYPLLMYIGKK